MSIVNSSWLCLKTLSESTWSMTLARSKKLLSTFVFPRLQTKHTLIGIAAETLTEKWRANKQRVTV